MHLDTWVFSIFPRISRAVSGTSDARNFRLSNLFRHLLCQWRAHSSCFYRDVKSRRDSTFSIPDLKTASTSAYILKSGFNKVWRCDSKPPSRPSGVPSVPLQIDNKKPPLKATHHGRIPAGLYPFYSSEFSLSSIKNSLFDFLPNTVSPSRSLLFLPPTPPLPPAPKRNQLGTTNPVRTPVHVIINTPASPSLPTDHMVPCSPTTLSLSPLPIVLAFSPPAALPPPPELVIKIAGPEGYMNADHHKSQITHFLSSRATEVANSLIVIWQLSHIVGGGRRGLESLKALFAQLDEKMLESDRTALSRFTKISITIPDQVKDLAPYNNLPQVVKEDDSIDLANAMDLHEFAWHGDFVIFASKFKSVSFVTLTCLNIKSTNISIGDAIALLLLCSSLQTVSLGTIRSEEDSDAIISESMKSSGGVEQTRTALPNLTYLALESDVALHPLVRRFYWTAQVSLNLTLRKQGTASLFQALDSGSQYIRP